MRYRLFRLLAVGSWLLAFASCGIVDIDVDEVAEVAMSFQLERDTVYLQQAEKYTFTPVFQPDSLSNQEVFYQSLGDTVAVMQDNMVVGVAPGWATIMAMSVSSRMIDSCHVCVLPVWAPSEEGYPYETIVYADVTVKGRPMDGDMVVAAICSNEVRGVGTIIEQHGHRYMVFRVGSISNGEEADDDDDEPHEVQKEYFSFQCYDRRSHWLYRGTTSIVFDGEMHGTPTNPVRLNF
jgi:hypothetical protein